MSMEYIYEHIDEEIEKAKITLHELIVNNLINYILDNELLENTTFDISKKYLEINEYKSKRKRIDKKKIEEQMKNIYIVLPYVEEALKIINSEIQQ